MNMDTSGHFSVGTGSSSNLDSLPALYPLPEFPPLSAAAAVLGMASKSQHAVQTVSVFSGITGPSHTMQWDGRGQGQVRGEQ